MCDVMRVRCTALCSHVCCGVSPIACSHRATDPYNLAKLQTKHWDPLVEWFNTTVSAAIKELGWDTAPVDLSPEAIKAEELELDEDEEAEAEAQAQPQQSKGSAKPQRTLYPADRLRVRHGGNVREFFVQPPAVLEWVRHMLNQQNDWHLAAMAGVVDVSQSTVLALNVLAQRVSIQQAYAAAHCDELFQQNAYGVVRGWYGHGIDREYVRTKIATSIMFLQLLHSEQLTAPGEVKPWLLLTPPSAPSTPAPPESTATSATTASK
jgi:hypothetical protein